MIRVEVELGERSYPIFIGQGLLKDAALMGRAVKSRQVMLVSNETVAPLYAPALHSALAGRQLAQVILPDGEAYKTMQTLEVILSALLKERFERGCTVLALGGGVVGDVAGFAAACYQRGVSFVQIPTNNFRLVFARTPNGVGEGRRLACQQSR